MDSILIYVESIYRDLQVLWRTGEFFAWSSWLDAFFVGMIIFGCYLLIKDTKALRIFLGLLFFVFLYIVAIFLDLAALKIILKTCLVASFFALPVVFQPELRGALEKIGRGQVLTGMLTPTKKIITEVIDIIQDVAKSFSKTKTGALIVIENNFNLKDLTETGIKLDAIVSKELLVSIFKKNSPLHDEAVIISKDRISCASAFLPLAINVDNMRIGSRHRAALGLSRETDAIIVIVSEETGKVSIAHKGKLTKVKLDNLKSKLNNYFSKRQSI